MSIGSGVLLPVVVEIPTFPILRPSAYTTGLGYCPTCENQGGPVIMPHRVYWASVPLVAHNSVTRGEEDNIPRRLWGFQQDSKISTEEHRCNSPTPAPETAASRTDRLALRQTGTEPNRTLCACFGNTVSSAFPLAHPSTRHHLIHHILDINRVPPLFQHWLSMTFPWPKNENPRPIGTTDISK